MPAHGASPDTATAHDGRPRILIVDDDLVVRSCLKRFAPSMAGMLLEWGRVPTPFSRLDCNISTCFSSITIWKKTTRSDLSVTFVLYAQPLRSLLSPVNRPKRSEQRLRQQVPMVSSANRVLWRRSRSFSGAIAPSTSARRGLIHAQPDRYTTVTEEPNRKDARQNSRRWIACADNGPLRVRIR